MDDLQEKLNSILNDPGAMNQIMQMAQSLGAETAPGQPAENSAKDANTLPGMDLNALSGIAGILQQSGIDKNQSNLLNALNPYLSADHLQKLKRAMQAAKLVSISASAFSGGGHV